MSLLKVITFVKEKHKGQVDLAGRPYFNHLKRVADRLLDVKHKELAYLHDIFEETSTSSLELQFIGIKQEEIEILRVLTKSKVESYEDYIKRVSENKVARLVKIADLEDNMNISRLEKLDDKDIERIKKYHKAYIYLKNIK